MPLQYIYKIIIIRFQFFGMAVFQFGLLAREIKKTEDKKQRLLTHIVGELSLVGGLSLPHQTLGVP